MIQIESFTISTTCSAEIKGSSSCKINANLKTNHPPQIYDKYHLIIKKKIYLVH